MTDQQDTDLETGMPHYCIQQDKITEMHGDVKTLRIDVSYIKGLVAGQASQESRLQSLESSQRKTMIGGFIVGLFIGIKTFFFGDNG
jgi:hypothetical protein